MVDAHSPPLKSCAAPYLKGDWPRSVFLENPAVDNLMAALVQFGTEFWTMRRRLMTVEAILESQGVLIQNKLENYQPTAAEQTKWDQDRDDFIERVFSVLIRETGITGGRFRPTP